MNNAFCFITNYGKNEIYNGQMGRVGNDKL